MPKKQLPELTKRNFEFQVRAETNESGSIIYGRPIVYDVETDLGFFREIIQKGALDKADLTDIRFLVNHDFSKIPLARSRKNNENSTMQLSVDEKGLSIKVILDVENNADSRALYSAVERGDITGMSFCFAIDEYKESDLESDKPLRTIISISSVIEVSAVSFPAYEDTEIYARDIASLENERKALENARSKQKELELLKTRNKLALQNLEIYGGK